MQFVSENRIRADYASPNGQHNHMTEQTYKIGEAAAMLNLKSYVLRFWESEFPQLNPLRTESGQRIYTGKDIDLLRRICNLLHDRGLTIEGAKKVLSEVQLGDEGLSSDILNEGYKDLFDELDSDDVLSLRAEKLEEPGVQERQPAADARNGNSRDALLASLLADLKELQAFIHQALTRIV
jgi:DNA-binding transcriptional MerR regulator